ncbi:MAG: hypothetical protein IJH50_01895 [Kiritimatiellae bacterium]|nr:hypothetical protein [Kiritimatiellia bacterium]
MAKQTQIVGRGVSMLLAVALGWAVSGVTGTAFAEQPDKWVRYVEATGSQYVDTGIIGRWNTKAECKVEWMELADTAFLDSRNGAYGDAEHPDGRMYFCHCYDGDGVMFTAQDTGERIGTYVDSTYYYRRFEMNRVYTYTSEFSPTNGEGQATNKIKVDNYFDVWNKAGQSVDTGLRLYVFACNQRGSATGKSKTRCYGLKIWQGSVDGGNMVLVRDFQPCMKNGRAGLYDAVSDTIFYSGSGTDLVCDENSEVPDEYIDYVESTGNDAYADGQLPSYIDTGIIGRAGTKMCGEFAILKSEDGALLGSRKGDDRFYMLHSYYSKFTCGYGLHEDNSKTVELGKRYWAETEFNTGSQTEKIWADGVTNTLYSGTASTSIDTGYPMYLFVCNVNGQPWLDGNFSMAAKARCYGLKIWQDGILVRDFRPCLKNGVAGLYDDVSKRIFHSPGTPLSYETRKTVKTKEILFVDYIESDGYNTLDTYVPARSGTRAKGDVLWTEHPAWWNYAAIRYLRNSPLAPMFWRQALAYLAAVKPKVNGSTTPENRFFMVHLNNQCLDVGYGTNDVAFAKIEGENVKPQEYERCSFDVTMANGTQTVIWNGTNVLAETIAGDVDTGDTLHLFSSGFWRHRSAARCYGLEIWQDGTKVRDFKPCIYQNKGMLYDTVTKMVYRPSPDIPVSRTGAVILTGDEKPAVFVDYVETDGTKFVDTGVIGRHGTAIEFEMSWRGLPDASPMTHERSFLGSRRDSGDTRFFMWFVSTMNFTYAYGNYRYVKGDDTTTWTAWNGSPKWPATAGKVYHGLVSFSAAAQTMQVIENGVTTTMQNITTYNNNIDSERSLYLFAANVSGEVQFPADVRFYWLKIWQDGNLLRNFKPVRLANGLVVLWDFVENKAYPAQSVAAPSDYTRFSAVGPDGAVIRDGAMIIIR